MIAEIMNGKIFNLERAFSKWQEERLREAKVSKKQISWMRGICWNILPELRRLAYYGNPRADVPEEQAEEQTESHFAKRAEHIPLQHITGADNTLWDMNFL